MFHFESNTYLEFLLDHSPLNDVRIRTWERMFPGCSEDIGEIFDTLLPTPKQVSTWKMTWFESTPYKLSIDVDVDDMVKSRVKSRIYEKTKELGIHPYFWEYYQEQKGDLNDVEAPDLIVLTPTVAFYKEEHLVMFKLAW